MRDIKKIKQKLDNLVEKNKLSGNAIPEFLRMFLFDFRIEREQYLLLINEYKFECQDNIDQLMEGEYGYRTIRYKSISDLDKMTYNEMLRYIESKKGIEKDCLFNEAKRLYEQGKVSGSTLNNFASFLDVRLNDAFVEQSINEGRYYRKEIK